MRAAAVLEAASAGRVPRPAGTAFEAADALMSGS